MLSKSFFESVYKLNECGSSGCGSDSGCGSGGCGFKESLQKMNECGTSSGCGSSSYPTAYLDLARKRHNKNVIEKTLEQIEETDPDYRYYLEAAEFFKNEDDLYIPVDNCLSMLKSKAIEIKYQGKAKKYESRAKSNSSLNEHLQRMNECGGDSGFGLSACGAGYINYSSSTSCKIGRLVRIAIRSGCGESVEVGRLLGYAD